MKRGLAVLETRGLRITKVSRFFLTPCFPAGAGPDFVNAAAEVETELSPQALLALFHEVEAGLGRERRVRWGQRTIDIDLIGYGQRILPDEETLKNWIGLPLDAQMKRAPGELILPHPRLQDRAFVLIPLLDVAPDWRHPLLGQSLREMADALPDEEKTALRPFAGAENPGYMGCQ